LKNEILEKSLEETWKNKEKFYEDTKDLTIVEIITKIENKYKDNNNPDKRIFFDSTSSDFNTL